MHFVRALRSTNTQLPQYMPKFFNIVEEDFNEAFQNAPIQDGQDKSSLTCETMRADSGCARICPDSDVRHVAEIDTESEHIIHT